MLTLDSGDVDKLLKTIWCLVHNYILSALSRALSLVGEEIFKRFCNSSGTIAALNNFQTKPSQLRTKLLGIGVKPNLICHMHIDLWVSPVLDPIYTELATTAQVLNLLEIWSNMLSWLSFHNFICKMTFKCSDFNYFSYYLSFVFKKQQFIMLPLRLQHYIKKIKQFL